MVRLYRECSRQMQTRNDGSVQSELLIDFNCCFPLQIIPVTSNAQVTKSIRTLLNIYFGLIFNYMEQMLSPWYLRLTL